MLRIKYSIFLSLFLISFGQGLIQYPPFRAEQHFTNPDIEYKTLHFDVPVDHFGFANQDTFKLRYLVGDQYWNKQDGPVFFYCGNEGDIEWFCENTGIMWEWAKEFEALVVFAEHRYYGHSMPYGNDSYNDMAHLGYLSSEQALADFASLLSHMQNTMLSNNPVIAFGGSYGGMLASWFRMKYPNIVQGSLAASAPIWMFGDMTPCDTYYKTVTEDFKKANEQCAVNVKNSWKVIDDFGSNDAGRQFLTNTLKLCKPLTSMKNISDLKDWLYNTYGNLAMVDYPYPATFLEPLPGWPIKEVCSHLSDSVASPQQLMTSLAAALNVYYNYTGATKCLNINSDAVSELGAKGWDFQACSEMFMPQCSTGVNDMFENRPFEMTAFTENCKKTWGVTLRPEWAITVYGGRDIQQASNIIFSNGGLDPWSGGGVLKNLSASLVALLIPEGAHHLDLRSSHPADPPSVIQVRKQEKAIIRGWIEEFRQKADGTKQESNVEDWSDVNQRMFERMKAFSRYDRVVLYTVCCLILLLALITIVCIPMKVWQHCRNSDGYAVLQHGADMNVPLYKA